MRPRAISATTRMNANDPITIISSITAVREVFEEFRSEEEVNMTLVPVRWLLIGWCCWIAVLSMWIVFSSMAVSTMGLAVPSRLGNDYRTTVGEWKLGEAGVTENARFRSGVFAPTWPYVHAIYFLQLEDRTGSFLQLGTKTGNSAAPVVESSCVLYLREERLGVIAVSIMLLEIVLIWSFAKKRDPEKVR